MSIIRKKVFVGMSGGVDSSVAALLLKEQGFDVTGVFMRCYNLDGCAERDAEDARRVANALGIPFYTFDFEKEYKAKVVEYMIAGYKSGITPNPDVMCNREIKFGLFLAKALEMGAEYVATGHYVRRESRIVNRVSKDRKVNDADMRYALCAARDANKDQSYFLWTLTQKELAHCLFPVGDLLKPEVRDIARKAGLPTAEKKDSQGICFIGDVNVFDFLAQHIKEKPGDIVNTDGKKVGEHRGVWFYTIGQRHGLDIGESGKMLKRHGDHATTPFYVAAKDVQKNMLVVAEGDENQALFRKEVTLSDVSFIDPTICDTRCAIRVRARVRYRQPLAEAVLEPSTGNTSTWKLIFEKPQKFVAPGQSAVFYRASDNPEPVEGLPTELEMLGGGIIAEY
jgi:tRNA-specific 2-thiouridylase